MHYTAFMIDNLAPKVTPKAVATVCHALAGCGSCGDGDCTCCEGTACGMDCGCHRGKSCSTCAFSGKSGTFHWAVAEMKAGVVFVVITGDTMQVDMYTDEEFEFYGLRELVDRLREFSEDGEIRMSHMHRAPTARQQMDSAVKPA